MRYKHFFGILEIIHNINITACCKLKASYNLKREFIQIFVKIHYHGVGNI